jgi:hypothetical protein
MIGACVDERQCFANLLIHERAQPASIALLLDRLMPNNPLQAIARQGRRPALERETMPPDRKELVLGLQ